MPILPPAISGIARGGGGVLRGLEHPPFVPDMHKAYVNVQLLADFTTLAKTSFVQANIEVQSSNIGGVVTFWSMHISNNCIAAESSQND